MKLRVAHDVLNRAPNGGDLSTRLMVFRKALGLSQAQLAASAEVSIMTISRIESGVGDPRLSTICRVADVLGISVGELVGGTDGQITPESRNNRPV